MQYLDPCAVCSLVLPRQLSTLQPPSVYLCHPALSLLFLPPSPSPLPRFFFFFFFYSSGCSLLVAMETEGLSSFRQRCGARGNQGATLNFPLSLLSLSLHRRLMTVYIRPTNKHSFNTAKFWFFTLIRLYINASILPNLRFMCGFWMTVFRASADTTSYVGSKCKRKDV